MQIGIIGINHKHADVTLRENIALACQNIFANDQLYAASCSFVILTTCNRVEIYFSAKDLAIIHQKIIERLRLELIEDFEQKLYSFFGKDCFLHLAKVTSGLDSLIAGETEIKGQVAKAYSIAKQERFLAKELHFLFQKSLQIAKTIRTKLLAHSHLPGLEHTVWDHLEAFFPSTSPRVLFVGASAINMRACYYLLRKLCPSTIWLTNRTQEKAEAIAKQTQIHTLAWSSLKETWHTFDLIISGAKVPDYIISPSFLSEKEEKPMLLIDLGVPRNIDPEVTRTKNLRLLNIDSLIPCTSEHPDTEQRILLEAGQLVYEETIRKCALFHTTKPACKEISHTFSTNP